ncbi:MAG: YitT family protein [Clostridia bacterium]|nr:YitT family protein [Clostridia bacterium]
MKVKAHINSFLLATLGAISFAAAVSFFYDPNKIAAGGITGFAVILSNLFPIMQTGTLTLIFNIPLLILAFIRFGKRFVALTVYATTLGSVMMNIFDNVIAMYAPPSNDLLIASLCGAVLDALGVGLVYRAGGCTGGTDIVIKFLRQKYRHIRTGGMSLLINMVVILATFIAFGNIEIAVYSAIAMVIASVLLDKVLYGGEGAKLVYIISDRHEEITHELLTKLEIGVTLLNGEGAYMHKEKKVIFCAVKKQTFSKLREIVKETDADAFMIISSATEIFGEGYKNQYTDEM